MIYLSLLIAQIKLCPLAMITLPDAASSSPNSDHILWLRQDLNAIVGSVSATLVQFISTSRKDVCLFFVWMDHMIHRQNLASPQQGNRTITDYMQDVKRNIDFLALMNVSIDFDELSIHVLNGLGPAYSNISHALQVRETLVAFEELFEQLLSYEAK